MEYAGVQTKKSKFHNALPQILAVMVKNFLMLSFGMNLGFPTILIGGLLKKDSWEFEDITEDQISWIGSISALTIPIGSVLSGIITQPLGRKRSMQFITIPFILSWIGFYFSAELWHIYLALSLMGFFGGLVEAPFSAYVSEITEPHLRGALSSSGSVFAIIGIFIQFMLGTFYYWRTCAIISCIFPTLTFILFCFVPESPYWLLLANKLEQAKQGLAWLRGWTTKEAVELEIQDLIKLYNIENLEREVVLAEKIKPFFRKSFIWPFCVTTFAFVLAQFSGSVTLQTYAISIFATLDVPINTYYATLLLAASQVVGSSVGVGLIHVLGKRKLLFTSLIGTSICNVLISVYAQVNDIKYILLVDQSDSVDEFKTSNWIPLALLITLSFIDHCGTYIIPWVIIGEYYSYETRSVGCGISSSVSYLISFVSNKLYLKMAGGITIFGTYLLYAIICFTGAIVAYFVIPETEGKTLEEISNHFEGISKLDNNVTRKQSHKLYNGHVNSCFKDDEVQVVSSKL